jgi:hypothetical protein
MPGLRLGIVERFVLAVDAEGDFLGAINAADDFANPQEALRIGDVREALGVSK